MSLKLFGLVVAVSAFTLVRCQEVEAVAPNNDVGAQEKVGIVYLVPLFQIAPKEKQEREENLNEIDGGEGKVLPLPRLLLILAPARNEEVSDPDNAAPEIDTTSKPEKLVAQKRSRRSLGGYGGGCNTCGGGGQGGGSHGGGGRGNGGGGSGSWSTSSASASSGGYGGGNGGSGGKYGHGRK